MYTNVYIFTTMSLPFNLDTIVWMSHGLDGIHETAYHKITQPTVASGQARTWELSVLPCWTPSQLQGQ